MCSFVLVTTPALSQDLPSLAPAPVPVLAPAEPIQVPFGLLRSVSRPSGVSYPPLARIAGVQGVVVVEITVNPFGPFGRVVSCKAVDGPVALHAAAERIMQHWVFEPFMKDGRAVPVQARVNVPFRNQDLPPESKPPESIPTVLEIEVREKSHFSVQVDEGNLRAKVLEHLRSAGLTWVDPSAVDPARAFHLKVSVQTLQQSGEVYLQSVYTRFSKWSDKGLQKKEPGQFPQVGQTSHVMGQRGEEGFQNRLLDTVRRCLDDMTLPSWSTFVTPKIVEEIAKPAEGLSAKTVPEFVEFNFSQVRVKHQPPPPPYPAEAKALRVEGTVVLKIEIDPSGKPLFIEAMEGPPLLLISAIRYALGWEFEPARLNGVAQYARFNLTMPFRLRLKPIG